MSFINGWSERLFLISFIILISLILIDYKFYFLPINGLWLILYVLFVIVSTIWITCVYFQKLLQNVVPFEYNYESYILYKYFFKIYMFIYNYFFINKMKITEKKIVENEDDNILEIIQSNFLDSQLFIQALQSSRDELRKEKSIDERIELLVNDIEQKFISKWYSLISFEDTFSTESKILLEGIIRRVLQVSVQVDNSKLICGVFVILLKHLKEYRKAIKRVNKNGGSIENVYRYSHIGNKSDSALEYFTHRLTANVLRECISWELWNSLPCRLLVSILSKRLTSYLIFYTSQPGWLNYKILYQSISKVDIINLNLDKYLYISISDVDLSNKFIKNGKNLIEYNEMEDNDVEKYINCTPQLSPKKDVNISFMTMSKESETNVAHINSLIISDSESVIEKALTKMITPQTAPILQRAEKSANVETKPIEINENSTKEQSLFKPKRSEPVKIHSAKSANKRWDERELANVSLGQDLLALEALDDNSGLQGFSGRRLWGYSADLMNEQDDRKTNGGQWEVQEDKDNINEENHISPKLKIKRKASPPSITHCLRPSTTSATAFVTNTIKPIAGNMTATTLHNMRELQQSTVNNVVRPVSNATEKAIHKIGDLQDEAVGVVEGIFDFGIAGIRRGLRLTGLQDDNEILQKQNRHNIPKLIKLDHVTSTTDDGRNQKEESSESVWMNPVAKEDSPNGYENQMLLEKSPNTIIEYELAPETNLFVTDSPEYEETADLASTISKLRSLLQQKSSESSVNTPAISPMLTEDKCQCLTPTEPIMPDVTRGDGGMQRFARTVTGMFNTFKTALPGNVTEQNKAIREQWIFVENETSDTDLPSLLNSLLVERRDYCTVDTAYEAMDSLDLLTESVSSQVSKIQWENQIYEDELDDLDTSIPITKVLLDIICECLQETKCALNQEPVMKALLILIGTQSEKRFNQYSEKILRLINKLIGPLPKNENDNAMAMNLEKIVTLIENSFPYYIKEVFGHNDIKIGLKYLISSLQSSKINQDIMLQFFELICSQLIYASSQMSPTPSA